MTNMAKLGVDAVVLIQQSFDLLSPEDTMQQRTRWKAAISFALFILLCAAMAAENRATAAESDAQQILALAGGKAGLCVHLGCGRTGSVSLIADLAAPGSMLVHGLAADDASLERARQAIIAQSLMGQASVEKMPLSRLPYLRDLANVVVIEDFEALAAQGLTWAEAERIVAPGGVICRKEGSRWTATQKARAKEMDEWTHPAHGPDGNRVSSDRLVCLPVGLRWQDGVPLNTSICATSRGWVVAGGRCFTLGPTVLENIAPAGYLKAKREEYLVARDAFNGIPLWKVDCETLSTATMVSAYNFAPLATDGQRVYVCKKDRLVALDAATGQITVQFGTKGPPQRLVLLRGVVVSSTWEDREVAKDAGHGVVYAAHWLTKSGAGAVEAFDAHDGKPKWSLPAAAQEMLAADGMVFLLLQSGNPPTRQEIVAVDLQSGQQRWRLGPDRLAPDPGLHLQCAVCGVLVVSRVKAKTATIHSATDGKVLWELNPAVPPGSVRLPWTPLVDGLFWNCGRAYDPQTGEVKEGAVPRLEASVCSPPLVVGRCPYTARGSSFYNPADRYHYVRYAAVRGACVAGVAAANGMFYVGQNGCKCLPGQLPGFVAVGPCEVPEPADFQQPRPTEKGPAFGRASDTPCSEADWPMYRHDVHRSGATQISLPAEMKIRWQAEVARPAKGPLADAWRARLRSWLTAPVVAEGRVFVAAVDRGQVTALDAATGKMLWQTFVGARVDSPPVIHRGLCLFGAHDGWVYAVSARDGKLAWRTRIAPWERRMVAFGQVESVWPAIGAVLVRDGVAYASAGRSSESDGGVALCALEPATGRQLWAANIGARTEGLNDVLAVSDGKIIWHHVQVDPQTGKLEGAGQRGLESDGQKPGAMEGLHDGTWTRLPKYRSGNRAFGRMTAEMFTWNESTLFGYECLVAYNPQNRWAFAMPRTKTAGTKKLQPDDYAWRLVMPPDGQVEAMALCATGLVLAGRQCDTKAAQPRGFVWIVSPEDGKKQGEYPLATPPAYDGLAIAQQQVYLALDDGSVVCWGK